MKRTFNIEDSALKQNPFRIPDDYFDSLYLKVYEKIFSESNGFALPEDDYFEEAHHFLRVITQKGQSEPFVVPGDFEGANIYRIQNNTEGHEKTTRIDIKTVRLWKFRPWAMAAAVAAIIMGSVVLLQMFMKQPVTTEAPCVSLACLNKKEILERQEFLDTQTLEESIEDEAAAELLEQEINSLPDSSSNAINRE